MGICFIFQDGSSGVDIFGTPRDVIHIGWGVASIFGNKLEAVFMCVKLC